MKDVYHNKIIILMISEQNNTRLMLALFLKKINIYENQAFVLFGIKHSFLLAYTILLLYYNIIFKYNGKVSKII